MSNALTIPEPSPQRVLRGELGEDVLDELRPVAERIRARIRRTTADIIDTGRDLINAKALLGHGRFLKWIAGEFRMCERTAQNYMRAAEFAKGKPETVADLPPMMLYALAAPSTPEPVKKAVIAALKAGKCADPQAIEQQIGAARAQARSSRTQHNNDRCEQVAHDTLAEIVTIIGPRLNDEELGGVVTLVHLLVTVSRRSDTTWLKFALEGF